MHRTFVVLVSAACLAACNGDFGDFGESSETDPTIDFEIEPPDVDTGWPELEDTAYSGGRRRAPDSGWRIRFRRD